MKKVAEKSVTIAEFKARLIREPLRVWCAEN
jgi:hypothetical protein